MLFLLPDTPYRVISIPSPLYYYWYFVLPYMYFLYLFLSFNKELFQLLNFTFTCTLIAFIKGLFFDRRVKIIDVLLLASYKTHRLLFPFLCASQNNSKCNEFSMASCGFTFRIVKLLLPYRNMTRILHNCELTRRDYIFNPVKDNL